MVHVPPKTFVLRGGEGIITISLLDAALNNTDIQPIENQPLLSRYWSKSTFSVDGTEFSLPTAFSK